MRIALIGAIDRNNYGDILFPLIVEHELSKRIKNINIEFYYFGSIKSNLSEFGAKKTLPLNEIKQYDIDIAVIVGGEVLSATWNRTYLHLQKSKIKVFSLRVLGKVIGFQKFEDWSRKKLGMNNLQDFPWIIDKKREGVKKIVYNTVSGTNFEKVNRLSSIFKNQMEQADYVSVRDSLTLQNLNRIGVSKVKEVPDSAFKMSDIFPLEKLKQLSNLNFENQFISFQVGKEFAMGNEDIIVQQLVKILENTDLDLVLISIGAASMHEDGVPLRSILKKLEEKNFQSRVTFVQGSIFDTMYTIASSEIFIGTSLHGNITALSYGHPSIAIDKRVTKLTEFLRRFSIEEQSVQVEYVEIFDSVVEILNANLAEKLINNSKLLKKKIDENFDTIAKIIVE